MWPAVFPPHGQGVENNCGEHTDGSRLKEDVTCCDRKGAFAVSERKRSSQNQRVEMAAMIRREYKGSVLRQVLTVFNRESMSDREVNSQNRKPSLLRQTFEQTAFASYTSEALGRSKADVTRWLELPRFHQRYYPEKIRCG